MVQVSVIKLSAEKCRNGVCYLRLPMGATAKSRREEEQERDVDFARKETVLGASCTATNSGVLGGGDYFRSQTWPC